MTPSSFRDHLNLTGESPLVGPNLDALGPRFPDMSEAYTSGLRARASELAESLGIQASDGVYAGILGSVAPTPGECEMYRSLGGDVMGPSLIPQVIVARHGGMEVLALLAPTDRWEMLDSSVPEASQILGHLLPNILRTDSVRA